VQRADAGEGIRVEGLDRRGSWRTLGRLTVPVRARFTVQAPHPNPFRGTTRVAWSGAQGEVKIQIFDIRGRLVQEARGVGETGSFDWTGADGRGREVSPGLYFVRMSDGGTSVVQRVLRAP
jgi:hypothetical protein